MAGARRRRRRREGKGAAREWAEAGPVRAMIDQALESVGLDFDSIDAATSIFRMAWEPEPRFSAEEVRARCVESDGLDRLGRSMCSAVVGYRRRCWKDGSPELWLRIAGVKARACRVFGIPYPDRPPAVVAAPYSPEEYEELICRNVLVDVSPRAWRRRSEEEQEILRRYAAEALAIPEVVTDFLAQWGGGCIIRPGRVGQGLGVYRRGRQTAYAGTRYRGGALCWHPGLVAHELAHALDDLWTWRREGSGRPSHSPSFTRLYRRERDDAPAGMRSIKNARKEWFAEGMAALWTGGENMVPAVLDWLREHFAEMIAPAAAAERAPLTA